jgi:Cytotoxic translational repressor of toxin-antitoxin stability system
MKVNVADQVSEYIKRLAPDSRKRLRRAIRLLEEEKGDIKALEDDLHGYYRVKVRSYRVIYAYRGTKRPGPPEIDILFCEHRSNLYEAFSAIAVTKFAI